VHYFCQISDSFLTCRTIWVFREIIS